MQAEDAPLDALPYPGGGVVEGGGGYTADLCGQKVAGTGKVREGGGMGEGRPKNCFSWAVVGRGVEGEDARVEGTLDDGEGGEAFGGGVVLVVEGGGAEDKGGDLFSDGGSINIGWTG